MSVSRLKHTRKQLEATCPPWCEDRGRHDWRLTASGRNPLHWIHQRRFLDFLDQHRATVSLGLAADGALVVAGVDMPPIEDTRYFSSGHGIGRMQELSYELTGASVALRDAARFLRAVWEYGPASGMAITAVVER